MNASGREANDPRQGNGGGRAGGLNRSIRPGVPVPATVLVALMQNGGLVLQGWRDGPNAYVHAGDAGPLLRELETAFGTRVPCPGTDRSRP